MKRGPAPKDLKERLLSKRRIDGDCWIWTGTKNNMGYGRIGIGHVGTHYVHRISYQVFVGSIPPGMNLCHSCDTPLCFNPNHLFPGNQKDNLDNMTSKGRRRSKAHFGEDHHSHKLQSEQVDAIRSEYVPRKTPRPALALKYGVCRGTIDKILGNKIWVRKAFLKLP